ncbi:Fc.00g102140.m01.CDS01 [Cosmosporella sp. VM-42]
MRFGSFSSGPRTRTITTSSSNRPWPFHNNSSSQPSSIPLSSSFARSRANTWGFNRPVSSILDSEIIPDYVVNFIRGETPETLARKQRRRGPQSPEYSRNSRNVESRIVDLFDSATTSDVNSRAPSRSNDMEKMLGEKGQQGPSATKRMMAGWRGGVALNLLLVFLILVVAIVCLILASLKARMLGGETTVAEGNNDKVKGLDRGIHVIVNIFGVVLIVGANYVFQILSSPTRREVNNAHEKLKWLDIGIPSLRNLSAISVGRTLLAAGILLLAVSSQIIYNAVIFTTETAPSPNLILVSPSFVAGAPFNNGSDHNAGGVPQADLLDLQTLANNSNLVQISGEDCVTKFDDLWQTNYDAVLIVASTGGSENNSLLDTAAPETAISKFLNELSWKTDPVSNLIDVCLARETTSTSSSLTLSGSLLGVVAILNLLFVLALVLAIARPSFEPLVTLGDALASFLADPDPTTQSACLMTKAEVQRGRWGLREAKRWKKQSHRWIQTPSLTRWIVWLLTWGIPVGLTAAAVAVAVKDGRDEKPFSTFGEPTLVFQLPDNAPRTGLAIVTALPQLLIAILYISTNALLTVYFLSHEFSQFAIPGTLNPLRISSGQPVGEQTTSLYLTLPRPLSWVLFFLTLAMAIMLSQGVFLITLSHTNGSTCSAIAFSPLPLLILLILLGILALFILSHSFRMANPAPAVKDGQPAGNPLALKGGSCSAVISARCHRVPHEMDVETMGLEWGVVREGVGMNAGHATFSARPVGPITVGRNYA